MKMRQKHRSAGFTLVELLVVIAIIAVLALLGFMTATKMIDRGKKVQALAQLRDLNSGFTMFVTDYQKPPIPPTKRGYDTIYGDPKGKHQNGYLVAVLVGDPKNLSYDGQNFNVDDVNPQHQQYIIFPSKTDGKGGVGKDGNLYDPWGTEIIAAINGGKLPGNEDDYSDSNGGSNDRILETYGLGEYKDQNGNIETKPRDQDFVFWTYGRDKVKGTVDKATGKPKSEAYTGSDDVISW